MLDKQAVTELKRQGFIVKNDDFGVRLVKYAGGDGTVVVPQGITAVAEAAFEGNTSVRRVTLPKGLLSVFAGAFSGCTSLSYVEMAEVVFIGEYAFSGCTSLSSVRLYDGLTRIGEHAFEGCTALEYIELPRYELKRIPDFAFSGCTTLLSIDIGGAIETVGDSAFKDCRALSSVSFGEAVSGVGASAFMNCVSLSEITLPRAVSFLGKCAFVGCTSLRAVIGNDELRRQYELERSLEENEAERERQANERLRAKKAKAEEGVNRKKRLAEAKLRKKKDASEDRQRAWREHCISVARKRALRLERKAKRLIGRKLRRESRKRRGSGLGGVLLSLLGTRAVQAALPVIFVAVSALILGLTGLLNPPHLSFAITYTVSSAAAAFVLFYKIFRGSGIGLLHWALMLLALTVPFGLLLVGGFVPDFWQLSCLLLALFDVFILLTLAILGSEIIADGLFKSIATFALVFILSLNGFLGGFLSFALPASSVAAALALCCLTSAISFVRSLLRRGRRVTWRKSGGEWRTFFATAIFTLSLFLILVGGGLKDELCVVFTVLLACSSLVCFAIAMDFRGVLSVGAVLVIATLVCTVALSAEEVDFMIPDAPMFAVSAISALSAVINIIRGFLVRKKNYPTVCTLPLIISLLAILFGGMITDPAVTVALCIAIPVGTLAVLIIFSIFMENYARK